MLRAEQHCQAGAAGNARALMQRKDGRPAAHRSDAPATSMGVVHGVHSHAPDDGPASQPPAGAGASQLAVLVLRVGQAADGGHAPLQDQALLAGRQPDSHVAVLVCAECRPVTGHALVI